MICSVMQDLTKTFEEQILDQLEKQASLLVEYIDEVDELQVNNNADSIADRLGKASNSRVTLILNDGTVIGDSYIDDNDRFFFICTVYIQLTKK